MPDRDVFISHASANANAAREVEAALQAAGHDAWLDDSDIHIGVLLRNELQQAIAASKAVVLLWSKPAAGSRWVAAEILTAFHLNRFILPCLVSTVELPQFLSRTVFCDFRRGRASALVRLSRQLQNVPNSRNEFARAEPLQSSQLSQTIRHLVARQREIVEAPDARSALKLQHSLDPEMRAAEKKWPFDSTILNLAGYHRKNAYMFRHWDEYCAGRFPPDPVLRQAERLFYETLFVNPMDYSALNGLGNILLFEGDLDAALFFADRAIACAREDGVRYSEAEHDRQLLLRRMNKTSAAAP